MKLIDKSRDLAAEHLAALPGQERDVLPRQLAICTTVGEASLNGALGVTKRGAFSTRHGFFRDTALEQKYRVDLFNQAPDGHTTDPFSKHVAMAYELRSSFDDTYASLVVSEGVLTFAHGFQLYMDSRARNLHDAVTQVFDEPLVGAKKIIERASLDDPNHSADELFSKAQRVMKIVREIVIDGADNR